MEIVLTDNAWDDLDYWKQTNNVKILKKIDELIAAIEASPFKGIGKPEPLKARLSSSRKNSVNMDG